MSTYVKHSMSFIVVLC